MKYLGLGDISSFLTRVMSCPKSELVDRAVSALRGIGALTANDELTPLGYRLAKMPMNPQIGKMVLMGVIFRCLDPVLTLAAALDMGKDPFYIKGKREKIREAKLQISCQSESDHLTIVYAVNAYIEAKDNPEVSLKRFLRETFLSKDTIDKILKLKFELRKCLKDQGYVISGT